MSKTPIHTLSPSPSIMASTQNMVKEHIQRDVDGMSLGDYVQNADDNVHTASESLSHASDVAAQSTKRSNAPTTNTMRLDVPAFHSTFSAPSPGQYFHRVGPLLEGETLVQRASLTTQTTMT